MVDKFTSADWRNAALLTIDTQNDFTLPNLPFAITGTFEIVAKMSHVLHAFRIADKPIIHVIRIYIQMAQTLIFAAEEQSLSWLIS
jgi:nicotinamidase-related amidase